MAQTLTLTCMIHRSAVIDSDVTVAVTGAVAVAVALCQLRIPLSFCRISNRRCTPSRAVGAIVQIRAHTL